MGRDRPAAPVAVRLLRHPRRARSPRGPVAARARLRHRRAEQHLHQLRRLGAPRRPAGRRARRRRRRCGRSGSASASSTPGSWPSTSPATASTAVAIWGDSPRAEREAALRDLAAGRVRVVFSVDLFNEGVDVPDVDTILMLRPTESPTLFLQQLGRGLRKTQDKAVLHRARLRRHAPQGVPLRPTLPRAPRRLPARRRAGRPAAVPVPAGRLPHGARRQGAEIVLRSLRDAIPTRWPAKVDELRSLRRERPDLGLAEFLDESGLDLDDVYDGSKSWSDLRQAAGARSLAGRPARSGRFVGRSAGCCTSTTANESTTYRRLLAEPSRPSSTTLPERERRLLHMLVGLGCRPGRSRADTAFRRRVDDLSGRTRRSGASCSSCSAVLDGRIDHVHAPLAHASGCPAPDPRPLHPHRDPRRASGSAPGAKIAAWQSGVYEAKAANAELLRVHARQEQRRLLPDHPVPRLRHQPHPDPLGEPVGHTRRQPDRPALPQPRARRPHDPAVHPAPRR